MGVSPSPSSHGVSPNLHESSNPSPSPDSDSDSDSRVRVRVRTRSNTAHDNRIIKQLRGYCTLGLIFEDFVHFLKK